MHIFPVTYTIGQTFMLKFHTEMNVLSHWTYCPDFILNDLNFLSMVFYKII